MPKCAACADLPLAKNADNRAIGERGGNAGAEVALAFVWHVARLRLVSNIWRGVYP
jgi:hypothetical protein